MIAARTPLQTPTMALDRLVADLDGARLEGPSVEICDITHDSRDVRPGSLFVALPGRQVDGRRFVPQALAGGAVAVALPDGVERPDEVGDRPVVRLTDPRPMLAPLCARLFGHPGDDPRLRLVGLTGTNGKSTVATMMAAMIRAAGQPEGVIGTLGNRVAGETYATRFTTPEAPALQRLLAQMIAAGVGVAVMEVTSVGLAEHRVDGVRFAAAGFLNLSVDHLDYHGDMATYGAAKKRLFERHLRADAISVIDVDDAFGADLAAELIARRGPQRVWRLSLDGADAEVTFECLQLDGRGVRGTLHTPRGSLTLSSPLIGRFNAHNVAMAAALALAVGLPPAAIAEGLAGTVVRGRLQTVPNDRGLTVIVDYAHTPDALVRVVEALKPLTAGDLWCVFGCAGDRDRSKRAPMGAAGAAADGVVITSDNPRSEDPTAIAEEVAAGASSRPRSDAPAVGHVWVEPDRARAIAGALAAARPGDTVLIAGKGHETYQEVRGVRHPFDDVEVATAALARLEAGA